MATFEENYTDFEGCPKGLAVGGNWPEPEATLAAGGVRCLGRPAAGALALIRRS
jgi:hypothetical protein